MFHGFCETKITLVCTFYLSRAIIRKTLIFLLERQRFPRGFLAAFSDPMSFGRISALLATDLIVMLLSSGMTELSSCVRR